MDEQFTDALQQVLAAHCTLQIVRDIEAGGSAQPLWQAIEASGFADALVGAAHGGACLDLSAVYPLLELCGSVCLPVPLAQTMFARAWLAAEGVATPPGSIALGWGQGAWDGTSPLMCRNVALARVATWVLVGFESHSVLMPVADATLLPGAFCLDATLQWPVAAVQKAQHIAATCDLKTWEACIASAQLAGAMQSVLTRSLQFANEREQFGRPIGKFQAIQHQLSVIAEHTFAARMAAQMGCNSNTHLPQKVAVAVAKARTSEAAVEVAALSHSIHGAIGFTAEFDLQLYTRRLHLWRQAGGSESHWHAVLGAALVDQHDGLALDLLRKIAVAST